MQNPAILEISDLVKRIDSRDKWQIGGLPIRIGDFPNEPLAWFYAALEPADVDRLASGECIAVSRLAALELQRKNAHSDQVRTMNTLEAFRNNGADA